MAGVKPPRGAKSELYCMDRAFGHDWDEPTWKAGPDIKDGRRTIYVHYRVSRCVRCGSERREIFEQDSRELVKTGNRYFYSRQFKERDRMPLGELRALLWKQETTS